MQSGLGPLLLGIEDGLPSLCITIVVSATLLFDYPYCYWFLISCKLSGMKTKDFH